MTAILSRRRVLLAAAATAPLALPGCALPVRGPAVPRDRVLAAKVLDLPNEHFLPTSREGLNAIEAEFVAAGERMRRVLLASAAIPGAFPPVMFDVTVNGEPQQELHVDGGAFAQAFLYPSSLGRGRRDRIARGTAAREVEASVIRNGRLDPEWAMVERRTLGITGRAISTMIAASGYNDVVRMDNNTQRDGIGFNLAYIGSDFTEELPAPFDQGFMRALFDDGYERGRRGYPWAHRPPI